MIKNMQEQNTPTIVILDLDNTVWYGNYQRHGYLFSELLYRLKNTFALNASVPFSFEQFLVGWNIYKANLHLTAPQQLDLFLDLLREDGILQFEHEDKREHVRQMCIEWIDQRYWELVHFPEDFYIADQVLEYGRRVCLVPSIQTSISFFRQQRVEGRLKIYAVSLNLQHISKEIVKMLAIADIFDEVFGAKWGGTSPTKEQVLQEILAKNTANYEQIMMIGDTVGDITAAQKAGIKTIALATGPTDYQQLLTYKPNKILEKWPTNSTEIEKLLYVWES
jgi:phosphoglycolate phosphatase-like HAD superfamily hydrolase